jgi:hypothetical protein
MVEIDARKDRPKRTEKGQFKLTHLLYITTLTFFRVNYKMSFLICKHHHNDKQYEILFQA